MSFGLKSFVSPLLFLLLAGELTLIVALSVALKSGGGGGGGGGGAGTLEESEVFDAFEILELLRGGGGGTAGGGGNAGDPEGGGGLEGSVL